VESISFNSYIFPFYSLNFRFKRGFENQRNSKRVTKIKEREANSRKETFIPMKYVHKPILLWIYIVLGMYYLSIYCKRGEKPKACL
jgi:hypothetical protein